MRLLFILLLGISATTFANILEDTARCFKESWEEASTIEQTPLSGKECYNEKTLEDMKKDGWKVKEKTVMPVENGDDYIFILTKKITKEEAAKRVKTMEITRCFRDDWTGDPKKIDQALLNGGECYNENSLEDMKKEGWKVKEKRVLPAENGNDFFYVLQRKIKVLSPIEIAKKEKTEKLKVKKAKENTRCFKNDWDGDNPIEKAPLRGGECGNFKSLEDMKKEGWVVVKKTVTPAENGDDYVYLLRKKTKYINTKINTNNESKKINTSKIKKQKSIQHIQKINLKTKTIKISNARGQKAQIDIGNLIVGQSGIIVHEYKNNDSLVVADAVVESTSKDKSILNLSKATILVQNAIPTSNLQPQDGDSFILNHMYNSSLLIIPNNETFKTIKSLYPKQNFLDSDIFAAHLKVNSLPVPEQNDIQKFCKDYDLGTIFIAVKNNLYILDTNSLKVLDTIQLDIDDKSTQTPFFTKVQDIKKQFWNFGDDEISNYDEFYLSLVNNTTYNSKTKNNNSNDDGTLTIRKLLDKLPW